ncbi:MAG TPA: FAD-binding oxidoreductase [Actinomycetes bacterium]
MRDGASVVVVGAGVVGCSIAFQLAERGVDVLVVERGTVCSGMTTPERAQVAFLRRPDAARRHPVVIDAVLGTYFRPHGGELSLLGVEAGHRLDVAAVDREVEGWSPELVADAVDRLVARVPSFRGAALARGHRGVYDTSPDTRAVLDRAPGVEGLFVAGGFSGTGFKTAPAVGVGIAEMVTGGRAETVDLHPFRLSRFAEGDPIVGDEYELPPTFGHKL